MVGTRAALLRYLDALDGIRERAKDIRGIKASLHDDTHAGREMPNIRTVRAYLVSAEHLLRSALDLLDKDMQSAENVSDEVWTKIKKELGYP